VKDAEVIAIHISSSCGKDFRFHVHGPEAETIDVDEWDTSYEQIFYSRPYGDFVPNNCNFTITAYPTAEFEEKYVVSRSQSDSESLFLPHSISLIGYCVSSLLRRPMNLGFM
jgi:hypothetical protein